MATCLRCYLLTERKRDLFIIMTEHNFVINIVLGIVRLRFHSNVKYRNTPNDQTTCHYSIFSEFFLERITSDRFISDCKELLISLEHTTVALSLLKT